MRVVFMGTPEFAVPSLQALADAGHEVALVFTRPDAVRGRGKKLVASPVKQKALELGIPVFETTRMTDEAKVAIAKAAPDVMCVVAYGCILPDDVLAMAPLGAVNVHASLLPRWRGAAPIQRSILAGDAETGVSIMRVAHDLDAGAWCAQVSVPVGGKGCMELTAELADAGAKALVDVLPRLSDGTVEWHEQDPAGVTLAAKVRKEEMRLDPAGTVAANALRVQASSDTAPARLVVAGKGVRAMTARVTDEAQIAAGVIEVQKKHVYLGCADGTLELTAVKPDGKKEMPAAAWASGLRGDLTWSRAE
ncbi:methionyl-tRNA formyltransferase [Paratractidigestivibacter sp.]|uniref:methionyl-tRNA formyltransferase n=1 Tax=Paratractidigestivibacter sp. TaxID=2847316 RepID=UPI002ABD8977|nr:methionyl-tRNA formyltransferase [Paratractidigestivibacter sp.]